MQIDALALQLRPRPTYESVDLGVRLAQTCARPLWRCYGPLALCVAALSLACIPIGGWLAVLVVFLFKPWLDRSLLFIYARAAFGTPTQWRDVWRARGQVWFSQLIGSFTWRRLSPRRAFTQPVYQLEGLRGAALSRRLETIRAGKRTVSALVTAGFSMLESAFVLALISLTLWFAPPEHRDLVWRMLTSADRGLWSYVSLGSYPVVALLLEPFYVAAGFTMYLNRRVELEAWDIEQELRRVFR